MKKGKHTEEQIIGVLKQVEAGRTVKEVARELGVSEATIYTWKSKYGGMEVNEARRLKELEDENRRLKHMVADQPRPAPEGALLHRPNQEWAIDFVADGLATGRGLRILTVVDSFTRECPAMEVDTG